MEEKKLEEKEKGPVIAGEQRLCNREQALRAIHLLEKGTRQAFLDGELSTKDTDAIISHLLVSP